MSLSYYFTFTAPATTKAQKLEKFLAGVESEAQRMGFRPTVVLNVSFDTPERRQFARRLTTGLLVEDSRLAGVALPSDAAVWRHDPHTGSCHVQPNKGVVLVVTDEQGRETSFGFFQFPEHIKDVHGKTLAETGLAGRWHFRDFVDSPDIRFRKIVRLFAEAGYVDKEKDEFHVAAV